MRLRLDLLLIWGAIATMSCARPETAQERELREIDAEIRRNEYELRRIRERQERERREEEEEIRNLPPVPPIQWDNFDSSQWGPAYIQHCLHVSRLRTGETTEGEPGVFGKITNRGPLDVGRVQISIYLLDRSGRRISEVHFHPVAGGSSNPLRSGYVREFGYSLDGVAVEDYAGVVEAEISQVLFDISTLRFHKPIADRDPSIRLPAASRPVYTSR